MTDDDQHARILDAVCAIPEGFVRTYGRARLPSLP
jgi:alkylated DNA nucleotide flippase Atl1